MKIGDLAQAAGVSCDTLRFYEKRGLIRSVRESNGYRRYAPESVQLIGYIRTAQKLGFSLAEIGENLPSVWNAENADVAVADLLSQKVKTIDARIAELKRLRKELLLRVAQICPLAQS
ncbi:MAG TPA: MerR family transcriptional regulator [Noviherbaspirillum sp.]|uniref:MerR family transcriptional regulator n=1 Tax=Noviherbaspirillum sp. TaxID=1926288 RepID=UPI002DDDB002|nr:MerR family transcriptional regulator [Noviherbaspirillum sp.]HEV2612936.1 MerR family transcriptional regulator [Noviherbaspirillum sp.]